MRPSVLVLPAVLLLGIQNVDRLEAQTEVSPEDDANEYHDPRDPLLQEKLRWDQYQDSGFLVVFDCSKSKHRVQERNFRLRFRKRMERVEQHVSENMPDVWKHRHPILAIGRCVRNTDSALPSGVAALAKELSDYEVHLGLKAAANSNFANPRKAIAKR